MINIKTRILLFLAQQSTPSMPFSCSNGHSIGLYCNISNAICDMLRPCQNNGICYNETKASYNYSCVCPNGFNGRRCEIDNRPCQPIGCWNNGIYNLFVLISHHKTVKTFFL